MAAAAASLDPMRAIRDTLSAVNASFSALAAAAAWQLGADQTHVGQEPDEGPVHVPAEHKPVAGQ